MPLNQLVFVGAVNWVYPAWRGGLYPADLPDDWLLSYYNTQFTAVYVPAAVWQTASEMTWRQWLDETREDFVFVLEPADAAAVQPASERVVLASADWVADHVWWLDERFDLRALAQRISRQAGRGEPLFVFSRSGDLALLEQANTLRQLMGY